MERKIAIAKIQKQVTFLENVINDVFARVSTDAMTLMRNAEEVTKVQNEMQQIVTLKDFLEVLKVAENGGKDMFELKMKNLLQSILLGRTDGSTCHATNAVLYYKYHGIREAYQFLNDNFKTK